MDFYEQYYHLYDFHISKKEQEEIEKQKKKWEEQYEEKLKELEEPLPF
jgi:hypothetical protein